MKDQTNNKFTKANQEDKKVRKQGIISYYIDDRVGLKKYDKKVMDRYGFDTREDVKEWLKLNSYNIWKHQHLEK